MNTALEYREPHRISAGMLALMTHAVFFSVLYFSIRWQSHSHSPEAMQVEMWESLPNAEAGPRQDSMPAPPVKTEPTPLAKVLPPVLPPAKADIEVLDKKRKKAEMKEKLAQEKAAKDAAELKALQDYDRKQMVEQARIEAEKERIRAEVDAATQTQIDRYQDLIRNKIRRKMKTVADVPETAEAIFAVTLLPDGMLMDDPVLVKSSGFPAYDDEAERAILSAEPLPVPTDVSLQKLFRKLKLSIKP